MSMQDIMTAVEMNTSLVKDSNEWRDKIQQLAYALQVNGKYLLSNFQWSDLVHLKSGMLVANLADTASQSKQVKMLAYTQMLERQFGDQSAKTILCRQCGKKGDVEWTTKQTRSADEGSTIFCVCNTCKARWRM